jgi:hypothetical protein
MKKIILFLLFLMIINIKGFDFELEVNKNKCFYEELPSKFDVYGEFKNHIKNKKYYHSIDFKVFENQSKLLIHKRNIKKGDFSFIAEKGGEYKFCFYSSQSISTINFKNRIKRREN